MVVMRTLLYLLFFLLPFYMHGQETYLNHHFEVIDNPQEINKVISDTKIKKYKLNKYKVKEYYSNGHLVAVCLDLNKVSPYQLKCLKNNDHLRKLASHKLVALEDKTLSGLSSEEVRSKLGEPLETRLMIDGSQQLQLFYYPHGKVVTFREDAVESIEIL